MPPMQAGTEIEQTVVAPGRVNLMGDHTDYNKRVSNP
jgi:galactokinase